MLKGKEGKEYMGKRRKRGVMVVGKRKPKKEGALGPAGFGPQAQSVEAHGQC